MKFSVCTRCRRVGTVEAELCELELHTYSTYTLDGASGQLTTLQCYPRRNSSSDTLNRGLGRPWNCLNVVRMKYNGVLGCIISLWRSGWVRVPLGLFLDKAKLINYRSVKWVLHLMMMMDDDKPVITGTSGTISKSFRKYLSHRPGNQTYRKQRKQPFWALRTCLGKYKLKSTKRLSWETASRVSGS